MNSRDRIIAAINHRQPDKVPVDLGSSTVTGISAIAYNNLKRHLSISSPTRVFDVVQQLANVDMEVVDLFGVDALDVNRVTTETDDWYEVELADGSKAGKTISRGGSEPTAILCWALPCRTLARLDRA